MFLSNIFLLALFCSANARVAVNYDDLSTNVISHKENDNQPNLSNDIGHTDNEELITTTSVPITTTETNNATNLVEVFSYIHNDFNRTTPHYGFLQILTPYVRIQNVPELARNLSKVDPTLFAGVESYSGYFCVDEWHNSNMFFWYFPVEKRPVEETPLILWLQGGPGASSMTGLFDEMGPITFDKEMKIKRAPYSWHQNHSLLFFDNPVGTGFSYTSKNGYVTDLVTCSKQLHDALMQFMDVFPKLRNAPLYIAGESYAGKYIPALAKEIHRRKEEKGMNVNLKGIILGNAYVDPSQIMSAVSPFLNNGLLDGKQGELLKPIVDEFHEHVAANDSVLAKGSWVKLIGVLLSMSNQTTAYNFLTDQLSIGRYMVYLEKPEVRRALHVQRIPFHFVNLKVNSKLAPDFLSSTKSMIEGLLEYYRVLTYCGQLDMMLPCAVSSEHHHTWQWSRGQEFQDATRRPFRVNHTLAGYYKTGGGLTEALVRGAGHMVALDRPAVAQALISHFTHPDSNSTIDSTNKL